MSRIFGEVASMSLMTSWLMIAVILFRGVMRNAPKWIICLLWGVVALRLVIPFQVESRWSLIPLALEGAYVAEGDENSQIALGKKSEDQSMTEGNRLEASGLEQQREVEKEKINTFEESRYGFARGYTGDELDNYSNLIADYETHGERLIWMKGIMQWFIRELKRLESNLWLFTNRNENRIASIWLAGSVTLLVYAMIDFLRIKRRVAQSIRWKENVYRCDEINTPFILGMWKPRIYLPTKMEHEFYDTVLRHEQAHLKRRDHWWKPIGFFILCLHWMNSLCWISYLLFCRDVEFACDESVTRKLDRKGKVDYCQTLLGCSSSKCGYLSVPIAFGEVGVKRRIKAVMKGKKTGIWAVLAVIILGGVVVIGFATSPKSEKRNHVAGVHDTSETQEDLKIEDSESKSHLQTVVTEGNMFEQLAYENTQAKQRVWEALQEDWERYVESNDLMEQEDWENVWIKKASLVHNEDGAWEPNTAKIYVQKHKERDDGQVLVRLPEDTIYGLACLGSRAGWRNYYLMKEPDGKNYLLEFYFDCRGKEQVELYYKVIDFYVSPVNSSNACTGQKILDEDEYTASGDFSREEFEKITEKTDRLLKQSELLIGNLDGTLRVGPENDYERYNSKKLYQSIMESE